MESDFYLTRRFGSRAIVCVIGLMTQASYAENTVSEPQGQWRDYVTQCLDTLIEHGTDRYGDKKTPLIMAVIDVRTLESPEKPELLDTLVRLEVGRLRRRGERGCKLWYDQALIRSMYRVSKLTGDAKYTRAADAYLDYFFQNCHKPDDHEDVYRNGMPCWGTHIYWDCYKDQEAEYDDGVHSSGPHEILVYHPEWADIYRINPKATKRLVDGIWKWHIVDKKTGKHNRHDDALLENTFDFYIRDPGTICDFSFAGGEFIQAFAFMYSVTKEQHYLDKARLVANWHWQHRNQETGLVPDAPSTGDRYDASHSMTCVTGPFVSQLLRAYEVSGEE